MKKFLLILAGVSSIALFTPHALAADKILSPVSGWNVEKLKAVGSRSACLVYTQYEDGVTLSLEALQSQLSALRLSVASGGFETGRSYDVTVNITPSYSAVKTVQIVSGDELVIDASNDPELLKAIQQGFIIKIIAEDWSYGLSLSGANEGVRRLLTCRDTNWRAARRVYDPANDQTAGISDQASPQDRSALPVQINAYPLDTQKSRTADLEAVEIVEAPAESVAHTYSVERETTEIIGQRGAVVDLSGADGQQVVVEAVNSVTRVHTPRVKIQPRNYSDTGETSGAVDVAVPVHGRDDLVRPPAFDESLLSEGQTLARADIQENEMPVPDRNPSALLSSTEESVRRLARKSDTEHDILLEDSSVPRRNERAVLSQTSDGIYTRPVVIPRIPEADLPSRIDITNRDSDTAVEGGAQSDYASRAVSNAELERELKSREVAEADYYQEQATTASITPSPVPTMDTMPRWNANQGDNLRETLAQWSIEEGVELIWDSEQQYALLSPIRMNASYEKAVAHVLNQFMVAPDLNSRPVGQLYVDPDNGSKVLIIQTDRS